MNQVTIKFGEGTESWKDMQKITEVLIARGYSVEPYEEIGTVKLTKEIIDDMSDEDRGTKKVARVAENLAISDRIS